jgi:hypothetical protein
LQACRSKCTVCTLFNGTSRANYARHHCPLLGLVPTRYAGQEHWQIAAKAKERKGATVVYEQRRSATSGAR